MDVQELIRRGYSAFGLGADNDVLAMFEQLGDTPAQWKVFSLMEAPHEFPAGEVAARQLFRSLPSQFEVTGVQPDRWRLDRKGRRLTVSGVYRARPRGTWETMRLPFVHIWWIGSGRVERVDSVLEGIEIRRLNVAA